MRRDIASMDPAPFTGSEERLAAAAMWVSDYSPWGRIDYVKNVAPGIQFVETDRHGGYVVSCERLAAMPEALRACSFTSDQYFEEDCSWCAVALAWPEEFTSVCRGPDDAAKVLDAARRTFDQWYRSRFGHLPGAPAMQDPSDADPVTGTTYGGLA